MNESDVKYLISSYQNTSNDLFTQSIATNAKIRQLTDLVEALTKKVKEQEAEIESLKSTNQKPKTTRSKKTPGDGGSFE
jgi:predicted RNase H-like nuclease (RuvC/YqgF family)|tara:strand:+ start:762 stop:998 length:237 start_codon:yes stop_codon:yes gene_type:complete